MVVDLRVGIVGGGLVGALEACLLAKRGFQVTLFEARHDGRNDPSYYGRSINLAISLRGISALKRIGLDHVVEELAIPMKARMIHDLKGKQKPIPYDPDGRCINSIERAALNNYLLNKAEQEFNVRILFNHKLIDMNSDKGELWFKQTHANSHEQNEEDDELQQQQLIKYKFDLILGCDGSRSAVRSLLSRQMKLELSQSYIEHNYMELRIDPVAKTSDDNVDAQGDINSEQKNKDTDASRFKMPANYLHIWPRNEYMMIALPNKDASFTCTLFMPTQMFDRLCSEPSEAIDFFKLKFPDSVELIGEKRIEETFGQTRPSSLISIKCQPYHYKEKVVLLGDSAHAMVPFYGQGMNCGFEDCLVLDELFDKYKLGNGSVDVDSKSSQRLMELESFSSNDDDDSATSNEDDEGEIASGGGGGNNNCYNDRACRLSKALDEYSKIRCANGRAMCDLAMYNYIEMRHLVNTWSFIMRKNLDNLLYNLFPRKWIPLYTMVTFSRLPINECIERRASQDRLLAKCFKIGASLVLLASAGSAGLICLLSRRAVSLRA